MKISVIVPSRLQVNPNSEVGNLWLDLALMSVRRQTCWAEHEWEIVVGMDSSVEMPGQMPHADQLRRMLEGDFGGLPKRFSDVKPVCASPPGQAIAVNAAARNTTGDVITILEDDDTWEPNKLAHQLPLLESFDFVSCNQREMADDRSTWIRTNDFPTPSGWVMKRALWDEMGGFDETFKYHMDTHFIGKLNAAKKRRIHLVEKSPNWGRPWLGYVAQHSVISETEEHGPLVVRTVNPKGGMARIASDPKEAAVSREEHQRMLEQFGEVPW